MWLTQIFRWPAIVLALASLTSCVTNSNTPREHEVYLRPVIITPVPAPREVVVVPAGYIKCRVVPGMWYYNTWIPQHHICTYAGHPERALWVEGYWACTKYSHKSGRCKHWSWRASHYHDRVIVY